MLTAYCFQRLDNRWGRASRLNRSLELRRMNARFRNVIEIAVQRWPTIKSKQDLFCLPTYDLFSTLVLGSFRLFAPVINLTAYPPLSSLSDDEISATVILTLQKSSNIFKPGLYYSYSFDSLQRFVRGVSTISTTREMLGLLKCQNYVTRLDKKYCEVTCCANTFPSLLILAVIA
jgi:hypothetical protein